jgi:enamine deaminase RidA (YjgF/YER057c/UK114 family)
LDPDESCDAKPPAATLIGVQSLASEDWLVEIEVTAVIR